MKRFLKIDFSIERTPDATALLHFRHLLEKHDISAPFFPNFPVKRAIRGRKRGNESSIARSFVLQFVQFVSADQLAVIIHYLSVIP